jgi:hypothetical protein
MSAVCSGTKNKICFSGPSQTTPLRLDKNFLKETFAKILNSDGAVAASRGEAGPVGPFAGALQAQEGDPSGPVRASRMWQRNSGSLNEIFN